MLASPSKRFSYIDGLRLLDAGRQEEAARAFALIRANEPEHAGAALNEARALIACGEAERGLEAATDACRFARAEGQFLRGCALNALGRWTEAIGAFEAVIAADPGRAAAYLNCGNAHADLDLWNEAERLCRTAIGLDPACPEAHASLGFVLTARGRPDEAVAACERAIALRPTFAQAHWNRACALLLAGDYVRGFEAYEWRKRHPRFVADFGPLPGREWRGEALGGRALLVRSEQGFGDTIQFARYLPLLAARGARVTLMCDRPLISLLSRLPGVSRVVEKGSQPPPYELWVDQLSLPRLFASTLTTVPAPDGYLTADPERIVAWRDRRPPGPAVGIVYAGNPAHANDRRRSLPAEAVGRLLRVPGVQFVNLQAGARSGEAPGLADLSAQLSDYAETAALVAGLDLVIAVDTSVAHLAGALGVPAMLLLPHAPDWRWLTERADSPWYRSIRIFRQTRPGDWPGVIEQVERALLQRRSAEFWLTGNWLSGARSQSDARNAEIKVPAMTGRKTRSRFRPDSR